MPGSEKPLATPIVYHHRARIAALSRDRASDDPELAGARRDLRAARLEEYIERTLAEAPPLTDEQLDKLAVLLHRGKKARVSLGGDAA